ncbi:MAG: hypothetical protein ACRES6_04615 [Steroidobacteraceae bacterium]
MSSSCRRLYVVLGAGALLGLTTGAHADNWEFLPRLEAGGIWNDNYRLTDIPDQELQVYGPYIDAQLSMDLLSPTSKLDIVPRVHATYFPTDHTDSSTDGYLDIDGEHKTLRSDFAGVLQYSDEEVFYSDYLPATFPGLALGQATTAPSGRITVSTRQQLLRAAPDYKYDLTQRMHLDLNADVEHASYTQSEIEQIGYTSYTGNAGLGFDVSPRSVLTVTALGTHFVPQAGGDTTNDYGAQAEWDLQSSQIAKFYARVGVDRTQAQTGLGTISSNGVTGGVGVDLRYQITEVTIDALRSLIPTSQGVVMTDQELRFRVLHAFYPRFSGFIGARGMRWSGASGETPLAVTSENYAVGEVGVDFQITESYRIESAYDYTWQQFPGTPASTSNAVRVSIIYQPLSRFEPLPEFTGIPPQER